ncbi:MAG: hypothetical protein ING02_12485 [Roseomonas sp.]|nr:hypothetical protein [Roseomonas sp.]
MTSHHAVAFVGQNANGILSWLTDTLAERAKLLDITLTKIDLLENNWPAKLNAVLSKGQPLFCFGYQGFGMGLELDSGNLWSSLKVPFISLMGDAPFYSPQLHSTVGPGFFHVYASEDFQNVYHEFMRGQNFSVVYKGFYPPNPYAEQILWQDRDLEIVYVKTGVDPRQLLRGWDIFPARLRAAVEDAAKSALSGQTKTIAQLVAHACRDHNIDFGARTTLFLRMCTEVDKYVRAVRAERMLHEVMRHGGHIFGDWPHIEKTNTRARFHGTVSAEKLHEIYGRSKMLVNVSPCTLKYVHERVVAAFLSKCFSISDGTAFMTQELAAYPNFRSVDIDSPELSDQLDGRIGEVRYLASNAGLELSNMLDESKRRAEYEFGVDQFLNEIINLVSIYRLEQESSFWSHTR